MKNLLYSRIRKANPEIFPVAPASGLRGSCCCPGVVEKKRVGAPGVKPRWYSLDISRARYRGIGTVGALSVVASVFRVMGPLQHADGVKAGEGFGPGGLVPLSPIGGNGNRRKDADYGHHHKHFSQGEPDISESLSIPEGCPAQVLERTLRQHDGLLFLLGKLIACNRKIS